MRGGFTLSGVGGEVGRDVTSGEAVGDRRGLQVKLWYFVAGVRRPCGHSLWGVV